MAFKLKTSKKAAEIFSRIESSEYLQCYTLVKLAIALSLRSEEPLKDSDFHIYSISIDKIYGRRTITPIGIHSMPPFLISTGTILYKLYHTFVQN